MNKQLLVYLSNYLVDACMGKVFVKALIQGAVFPALNHAVGTCTWEISKKKVTISENAKQERHQVLEDVAWYKDEYGAHMSTKGRKNEKEYSSPEMMYDIDREHSIKTIHEHPWKGYAVTLGAATIDLQIKTKSKEDFVDDESSEESSDLSNMSIYQLIARLCKLGGILYSDKGPAPHSKKGRILTLLRSIDESCSSKEAPNSG